MSEPTPSEAECPECGTGLCAESQADGVPCDAATRECDSCGRARPKDGQPAAARPDDCLDRAGM